MPSAFHGLSTMNSALRAFQRALDVTGHNISNASTPGYSRQQISPQENMPTGFGGITSFMLGNGVNVDSVKRIQDAFLAARKLDANSEGGRLDSLMSGLKSIEAVMQEPGGASINDALDKFFNSWSALGSNPSQAGLAQQVQQTGAVLGTRIRNTYASLKSQIDQANAEAGGMLNKVQQLSKEIAQLNKDIRANSATGATPNDLMDMRDHKLSELSDLVDVRVQNLPDGSASVYLGSLTLVDQTGSHNMPSTFSAAAGQVSDANGNYSITGGRLAGAFQLVQKAQSYMAQLDTFANNVRSEFNSIHKTGTNGLGATGQNFFNDVTPPALPSGAIDFDLDPGVAANYKAIATGVSGNPGDGGLALSMSAMRDTQISGLGNRTMRQFYTDLVGSIAQDSSYTQTTADTQSAVSSQLDQQIQSVSGVSLDEEMASMLRYQRSYQAAAKALSIFDQTTEDLLGMIR